jgi:hypothetical protein
MSNDKPRSGRARLDEFLRESLNLLRLTVRPDRLRLSLDGGDDEGQQASPAARRVLSLSSEDGTPIHTEWGAFQFRLVTVDIINRDDELHTIGPNQDGSCVLGDVEADQSHFSARVFVPASQFETMANVAVSRPDAKVDLLLYCREPLADWDGQQRLHIVKTRMEPRIEVADKVPECAFRDLVNQEPRVALFEDIIEIAHVPEIRNMIRTVQFSAVLLVVIFVFLLWLGFSGKI